MLLHTLCAVLVLCLQVLCREFAAVRQWHEQKHRGQAGRPAAAAIDAVSGTLAANTMSLLRHAYILIAGGATGATLSNSLLGMDGCFTVHGQAA